MAAMARDNVRARGMAVTLAAKAQEREAFADRAAAALSELAREADALDL